ncbi:MULTISPECIES: DUF4169 family protein [unclassified Mesorhizobium]|uniref:DUF4169 family protein n=1 Tax=unclassified Mesorhizobium TaxID=325217 RepID=UPI000FE9266E|nr:MULTISPECIES: DUF4169 family protein [unclassified Mesorhizobium]RWI28052.1 MAG: DUF4169 family protein [Mesorhizobium sp.]RWK52172.1 MAG: DUF4169 family protein [Mesorhizobium sp.]RWK96695.1 MAG: DUF4169 family protein [Mesorhizobium sp.]TIQ21463.1 MAG: DUF4169 family protein [Mesorhizobium sp.]TIQ29031.1 MAG: DUF4169 family protein [Mesorhizobium sp.]
MADIVNLRQARKQKARADKERLAEQNRALHGRSKADRERDRSIADKAEKFVAGHRREVLGNPDSPDFNPKNATGFSDKSDA